MPTSGPDVLVLHATGDDAIARSIARALAEYQCRCWTPSASNVPALAAHDLAGFTAVLAVVSRASHASEAMTGLVRSALAGAAPLIPFVVDPPPTGSPLGHYIRSLHWIDGAAGPAALRSDSVRAVLGSTRVTAGAGGVAVALHASGLFAPLQVTAGGRASYRPSNAVRVTARALAIVQIAAASLFGIIALAVAFFPETTTAEAPINVSIYLAVASLPAWCAFLAWTRVAHSNARALQLPDVGSQAWLLCQVAVPGLSLVLGGRAIGRLWAAIQSDGGKRGWADVVTRFQIAWTAAGMILVVTTIASAVLAALGSIAIALTVSVVQSLATVARGVLRARIIKDVGPRLDVLARRQGSL
jgi:hypothetical protein